VRRSLLARVVVLVASALVAGSLVLALGSRNDLRQAHGDVATAWTALRPPLESRYRNLGQAREAVRERLGGATPLLDEIDSALARWRNRTEADEAVSTANRLEGLAARLAATVRSTPRLRSAPDVAADLAAFERGDPRPAREAYNRSVAEYEQVRGGFPRRLVAGALGFGAALTLEPVLGLPG
jgi:hypothetical protein